MFLLAHWYISADELLFVGVPSLQMKWAVAAAALCFFSVRILYLLLLCSLVSSERDVIGPGSRFREHLEARGSRFHAHPCFCGVRLPASLASRP